MKTKYLRQDFTYEATSNGYMLYYKGQAIGGYGVSHISGGPMAKDKSPMVIKHEEEAETTIQRILVGCKMRMYQEAIEDINAEGD